MGLKEGAYIFGGCAGRIKPCILFSIAASIVADISAFSVTGMDVFRLNVLLEI
jgi:hypothetical protein